MSSIFSLKLYYNTFIRGLALTTMKTDPSLGSLPILHNWHFITQLKVVNAFSPWTIAWDFLISISFPVVINYKIWPQIPPMILCNMTLHFLPSRGCLFPLYVGWSYDLLLSTECSRRDMWLPKSGLKRHCHFCFHPLMMLLGY